MPSGLTHRATAPSGASAEKRFLDIDHSACAALDVAKTLYKIPALLTTYTRCGRAQCRCTAGHLHGPYYALHWREGAIQRRLYVRPGDVPAVRAIIEQRRHERAQDRLANHLDMMTWQQMARQLKAIEARIREEQGNP